MLDDENRLKESAEAISDQSLRDQALEITHAVRESMSAIRLPVPDQEQVVQSSLRRVTHLVSEFVSRVQNSSQIEEVLAAATAFTQIVHLVYAEPDESIIVPTAADEEFRNTSTLTSDLAEKLELLDEGSRVFWLGCPVPSASSLINIVAEKSTDRDSAERANEGIAFIKRMIDWLEQRVGETDGELKTRYESVLSGWRKKLHESAF